MSYRWVILLLAYFGMATYGLTLQSVPPVLSLIIQEFGLSHAEAGALMSAFAVSGIFLAIPIGLIADRVDIKRLGVAAYVLTIVGVLIVAWSPGYSFLLVGRVITGIGAITAWILAPRFAARWFADKGLGLSLSVLNTAVPLSAIVSFLLFGSLAEGSGWRGPITLSAVFTAIALLLFLMFYRGVPASDWSMPRPSSLFAGAGHRIWLLGVSWMSVNASLFGFMTFAPTYLGSLGIPLGQAALLASTVMWGYLVVTPSMGFLMDRGFGRRIMIMLGAFGMAVIVFLFPLISGWLLPLLALLAFTSALIPAAIFSFPPFLLDPNRLGLGFGLLAALGQVGTVLGPLLVGTAKELSGSYTPGFWLMSSFALLIGLAVSTLPSGKGLPDARPAMQPLRSRP